MSEILANAIGTSTGLALAFGFQALLCIGLLTFAQLLVGLGCAL